MDLTYISQEFQDLEAEQQELEAKLQELKAAAKALKSGLQKPIEQILKVIQKLPTEEYQNRAINIVISAVSNPKALMPAEVSEKKSAESKVADGQSPFGIGDIVTFKEKSKQDQEFTVADVKKVARGWRVFDSNGNWYRGSSLVLVQNNEEREKLFQQAKDLACQTLILLEKCLLNTIGNLIPHSEKIEPDYEMLIFDVTNGSSQLGTIESIAYEDGEVNIRFDDDLRCHIEKKLGENLKDLMEAWDIRLDDSVKNYLARQKIAKFKDYLLKHKLGIDLIFISNTLTTQHEKQEFHLVKNDDNSQIGIVYFTIWNDGDAWIEGDADADNYFEKTYDKPVDDFFEEVIEPAVTDVVTDNVTDMVTAETLASEESQESNGKVETIDEFGAPRGEVEDPEDDFGAPGDEVEDPEDDFGAPGDEAIAESATAKSSSVEPALISEESVADVVADSVTAETLASDECDGNDDDNLNNDDSKITEIGKMLKKDREKYALTDVIYALHNAEWRPDNIRFYLQSSIKGINQILVKDGDRFTGIINVDNSSENLAFAISENLIKDLPVISELKATLSLLGNSKMPNGILLGCGIQLKNVFFYHSALMKNNLPPVNSFSKSQWLNFAEAINLKITGTKEEIRKTICENYQKVFRNFVKTVEAEDTKLKGDQLSFL